MNHPDHHHFLREAEKICRQRRVRLTSHRRTVLELLYASSRPLTAYEILEQMGKTTENPAPPTVYRALDFLQREGLVHKIESLHAFIGCTHPEQPHASQFLICDDCGEVNEIENCAIQDSLDSIEERTGFRSRHPVVELLGTCAACSEEE